MTIFSPVHHFAYYQLKSPQSTPVQKTLPLADVIRKYLLRGEGWYNFGELGPIFSGKDKTLSNKVDHQHSFIMPLDTNHDGFIDHVLIHSPIGFSIPTLVALDRLQQTIFFKNISLKLSEISVNPPTKLQQKSKQWRSVTPLLSFRHHKKNQGTTEEWWESECDRFCQAQKLPTTVSVSLLTETNYPDIPWKNFSLKRPSKPKNQIPQYVGLCIGFKNPQSFPLCLGEYAHFGMGRFEPYA